MSVDPIFLAHAVASNNELRLLLEETKSSPCVVANHFVVHSIEAVVDILGCLSRRTVDDA